MKKEKEKRTKRKNRGKSISSDKTNVLVVTGSRVSERVFKCLLPIFKKILFFTFFVEMFDTFEHALRGSSSNFYFGKKTGKN